MVERNHSPFQKKLIYRLAIHLKNLQDIISKENCSEFLKLAANNATIALDEVNLFHSNYEKWLESKKEK